RDVGVADAALGRRTAVTGDGLGLAHRERDTRRAHRAEAGPPAFRGAQEIDVDLHLEDLLHAADVGVAELLVGVDEGARAPEAGGRIHDLVAVHVAPLAAHLLLWSQGEAGE